MWNIMKTPRKFFCPHNIDKSMGINLTDKRKQLPFCLGINDGINQGLLLFLITPDSLE